MYRYSRSGYYGGKRYSSFGRTPYSYRRGAVGRAQSSGFAAKRADKQENLNITVQGYINFTYGASNPPVSNVIVFHPYLGGVEPTTGVVSDDVLPIHGGAINDRSFRLKCSQYDEIRLDSMKVYINPVVSNSSATSPAMTMSTIWDRKCGPYETGLTADIPYAVSGRLPTAEEVISNEGSIKTVTNMNSTRGIIRSIYARNMQEKSFFWDSTIHYNTTDEESPLDYMYLDAWEKKDGSFCPALFVVSQLNQTTIFGQSFICSYRVEYNFTFRNPKSEISDFITMENPTYTNPIGGDAKRSAPINEWMSVYTKEKRKALKLIAGSTSITIPTGETKQAATAAASDMVDDEDDKDTPKA